MISDLDKRKDKLIKEFLASNKIDRTYKLAKQLKNLRKDILKRIDDLWEKLVKSPDDPNGQNVPLWKACTSTKCNPKQIKVTSDNPKYDDIEDILCELEGIARQNKYESTLGASKTQYENFETLRGTEDCLAWLSTQASYEESIETKKEASKKLNYLKSDLKKLGTATSEDDINKFSLKCATGIKDFAWWRVSGKETNIEKEEKKRKNTGWALARVLFPKGKAPDVLNTMTLLVNMYFLGYKTSLLSISSVPVRLLRKNTKLAIARQYAIDKSKASYSLENDAEDPTDIYVTNQQKNQKDKIEQKELDAFFKELDNIKDPKPSKIASFFKKKSK